jgi:peroxiredoxin Q/BCP
VVGVSNDLQQTNDRFRSSLELPYPMVGDPEATILKAYDVRWPIVGICRRISYVIGRDRKIRHAFKSETNPDAHVSEACAVVAKP